MAVNDVTIRVGSVDNTGPELDALKARISDLAARTANIDVNVDDKEAKLEFDKLVAQLQRINATVSKPKVTVAQAAQAEAQLSAVDLALDKINGKTADIKVQVDGASAATAEVEGLGEGLGKVPPAMGVVAGAGAALLPVLVTVGTGMAGFGVAAMGVLKPIEDASAATGGLKANLGTLDTGQQDAAKSLLGLEGQFQAFSKSMQPEVLAVFNTGIKTASGLLSDVGPVAKATGTALDGLLSRVDDEFQSGTWQNFFGFMAKNAGPDIQLLSTAFVNLMDTIPGLVEQLQPAATSLLELVDDATKLADVSTKITGALDGTGKSAQQSSGFIGLVGQAARNATQELEPGLAALPKLKTGLDDVSGSSQKVAGTAPGAANGLNKVQTAAQLAALQVQLLDNDWKNLVGDFATKDQVFQNASTDFDSLKQTIKESGANSAVAKGQYDTFVLSIQSSLTTLKGAGASNSTLNDFLQTQIERLKSLGPLTGAQAQELQGLEKYQTDVANSTTNMSKQDATLAKTMESSLTPQIKALGAASTTTRTDTDNLTNAILNTGTKSAATASDRAKLIADLVASGVSAKTATSLVDSYIKKLGAIPKSASTNVVLHGSGSGTISVTESLPGSKTAATEKLIFGSTGMRLPGYGGGDVQPAMLEPGETVVSKESSRRPDMQAAFKAAGVPGYAGGGLVSSAASAARVTPWATGNENSFGQAAETAWAQALVAQAQKDAKAAAEAAQEKVDAGGNQSATMTQIENWWTGAGGPGGSTAHIAAAITGAESGFNVKAVQQGQPYATTGWGLWQITPGNSEPQAGIDGALLTGPSNAVAAVAKYRGAGGFSPWTTYEDGAYERFMSGGGATSAGYAVVGEQGRELVRLPGGASVIPNGSTEAMMSGASGGSTITLEVASGGESEFEQFMLTAMRKWVRVRGGNVQTVLGRS